ncbi:GGDEF domain-containing protein [Pseudomonas sp. PDM16]|nr:GGDEF domain-containing protein [Pseudomonas sp. PDM16]
MPHPAPASRDGESVVPGLAAYRPAHLLTALPLLVAGLLIARMDQLNEFFLSLFNVLPTLLLLLGGAFCIAYGRQRELSLLLVVYLAYFLLDDQTDHFREHGKVRDDAALVFHLCSLLLPALYGLYGAWRERSHLVQDLIARAAVLLAVGGTFLALARRFPQGLQTWLAEIHWPLWHGQWMSLIQLAYPMFLIAAVLLLVQYLRQPRPVHAALLCGLLGLIWMLPNTFILPHALQVMSSLVMLMLVAAVVHEAYQMAYRDELTGLPGRRALNDRLDRLGRNYVIAMADVDHFKKFNDTHGHDVGDQVLRLVASQLRRIGGGGKAYRFGGEEFTSEADLSVVIDSASEAHGDGSAALPLETVGWGYPRGLAGIGSLRLERSSSRQLRWGRSTGTVERIALSSAASVFWSKSVLLVIT